MLWAFSVVPALTDILDKEFEEALEWANRTLQIPNAAGYWPHAVRASALANLERIDEAKKSLALALNAKPDLAIDFLKQNCRQSTRADWIPISTD